MKKLLFAIPIVIMMTVGCNSKQEEVDQLNRTADSLRAVTEMRDSVLGDFLTSYNEIQVNLESISGKQNKIEGNMDKQGEITLSKKERINQDISDINTLVQENRAKIAELTKKLKRTNSKNSALAKTITNLNDQLTQKEAELADLNTKLEGLNIQVAQLKTTVDTLNSVTANQAGTISDQTSKLHTAYYIISDSKDLKSKNIISSSGGFLGMGKTQHFEPKFKNEDFTKIDYTQTLMIPLDTKEAKMLTSHPGGSFSMEKNSDGKYTSLKIIDPDKFWSISKYLVIIKG